MADEFGDAVTAGGEDRFEDLDLEGLAYVVSADFEKVPTWRKQASGYRRLVKLAEQLQGDLSGHVKNAMDYWSSKGAVGVQGEAEKIDDSFRRGLESARGNAEALERIADEVEDARAEISRLQTEWAEMKANYQKNPHLFDGYAADGMSGYQAAKASYDQSGRERMHAMSVVASQAWYTNMHKPGDYTGPLNGKEPVYPVKPHSGSGSGGGKDTTYPFTYHPPPSGMTPGASPSGHELPAPTIPSPPSNNPSLEFPTTPVHTPGPSVITSPVPAPGGPGLPPPGGFPTGNPPMSPSLFNPMRPGGMQPGAAGSAVPGQRTSPSVLGQRPTQARAKATTPPRAAADKGVIRNPKQANASTPAPNQRSTRRQDRDRDRDQDPTDTFRDGPDTDELFEGLALDSVPDVVRPEAPPPRVRRRDVGPVLRRKFGR